LLGRIRRNSGRGRRRTQFFLHAGHGRGARIILRGLKLDDIAGRGLDARASGRIAGACIIAGRRLNAWVGLRRASASVIGIAPDRRLRTGRVVANVGRHGTARQPRCRRQVARCARCARCALYGDGRSRNGRRRRWRGSDYTGSWTSRGARRRRSGCRRPPEARSGLTTCKRRQNGSCHQPVAQCS
jgi:hypothetical protein